MSALVPGSGAVQIDPKNALAFSSFGERNTSGPGFSPRSLLVGERFYELDRLESYFLSRQHDGKTFDFDGRFYSPRSTTPTISAEKFHQFVPLKARRPSTPYPLARVIVNAFTSLVFGEGRFPSVKIDGDPMSEDFLRASSRVGRLPMHMIRARNIGGSMGTVGVSWSFYKGKPRFEVHNPKNLHVHEWSDRVLLSPAHITEIYTYFRVEWDGKQKQFVKVYYWFRRDWTEDADIVFKDVRYEKNKDPAWAIDEEKSAPHGEGRCHFEWIQNLPSDEIDGQADYEGLLDQFDAMDTLVSVVMKGATLNLDPTLLLKMDPELVSRKGVLKGSEHALIVGESGSAEYMELGGASLEAGSKLIDALRRQILETAQCVVADPNDVAAQGTSSVALKMMYAPMLAKADILREQYGTALERILDSMGESARKAMAKSKPVPMTAEGGFESPVAISQPGEEEPATEPTFDMPPRVVMEKIIDQETGLPLVDPQTGEELPERPVRVPRTPGDGGEINLHWPPYFAPTPDDQSKIVTTLSMAVAGKAVLSTETATDIAAMAYGLDPAEERKRILREGEKAEGANAAMFPGTGGQVDNLDTLPDGSEPKGPPVAISQPAPGEAPGEVPDEGLNPEE
jgi:hypothetical protein